MHVHIAGVTVVWCLLSPLTRGHPCDDKQHCYLVQGIPLTRIHLFRSPLWRRLNTRLYYFQRQSSNSSAFILAADLIDSEESKRSAETASPLQTCSQYKDSRCAADPHDRPKQLAPHWYSCLPLVAVPGVSHFLDPIAFRRSICAAAGIETTRSANL